MMDKSLLSSPVPRLAAMAGAGAAAAMLLVMAAGAARADDATPKQKSVCLWVNRIDHTQVLNDHQILFYEVGGKIWQNNLTVPCRTLTAQDGFFWDSGIPEFCDNVEQIKVLRTHESCLLGAFVPYVPGGAQPVGTSAPKTERWMKPS